MGPTAGDTRTEAAWFGFRWPQRRANARPDGSEDRKLVERAFEQGIRFFDCATAPQPTRALATLAEALGERMTVCQIMVAPLRDGNGVARDDVRSFRDEVTGAVASARERTGPVGSLTLALPEPPAALWESRERVNEILGLRISGEVDRVAALWPSAEPDERELRAAVAAGVDWLGAPVHLVDEGALDRLEASLAGAATRLLAYDPFGGGRLDGSLFRGSVLEQSGPPRPDDLEAFAERFAPVTELGFLTADKRRRLPEAALQFLASRPTVSGILLEGRSPGTLELGVRAARATPLTRDELDRIAEARERAAIRARERPQSRSK